MRSATITLAAGLFLAACGDDASTTSSGSGGNATSGPGAGQGGDGGDASSGTLSTGSSNACDRGLVECDGSCVDVFTDAANCGACGVQCSAPASCYHRECIEDVYCPPEEQAECEGVPLCRKLPFLSIDDCGACGNACADDEYCYSSACTSRVGDGTSCDSPFVVIDDEQMQFWFDDSSGPHLFPCGPLEPRPTVWFRWTAEQDDVQAKVDGNAATDDLILEMFDDGACGAEVSVGCNDNRGTELLPELEIPTEPGHTYFIAVGSTSETPPSGRFTIRMDD